MLWNSLHDMLKAVTEAFFYSEEETEEQKRSKLSATQYFEIITPLTPIPDFSCLEEPLSHRLGAR